MKNKLSDLNNHLFAELERLGDEDLTGDALHAEISRAKAITGIASQAIANAGIVLKAETLRLEYEGHKDKVNLPALLTGDTAE